MSDATVRTYSPSEVNVLVNGIPIAGFADGTFIKIVRNGDAFTKKKGSDGTIDRVNNNAFDYEVEFVLRRTSPFNAVFSGLLAADQISNEGIFPLTITDNSGPSNGPSLFAATQAWFRKDPDVEYADTLGNYTWKIDTGIATNFIGGN